MGATMNKPRNKESVQDTAARLRTNRIIKHLLLGELIQGQALKSLRISILGLKQDVFARLVDVSKKHAQV